MTHWRRRGAFVPQQALVTLQRKQGECSTSASIRSNHIWVLANITTAVNQNFNMCLPTEFTDEIPFVACKGKFETCLFTFLAVEVRVLGVGFAFERRPVFRTVDTLLCPHVAWTQQMCWPEGPDMHSFGSKIVLFHRVWKSTNVRFIPPDDYLAPRAKTFSLT